MALERMIITCGGTGGHFYPGLAIAKEFQDRGGKVILLLSGVNAEKQSEIARSQGVGAECLPMMPHPLKKPFKFLSGLFGGISGSRRVIKRFAPQAILGMGSFASLPPIAAAKLSRIPLMLHDGNARVGRANRWFSCLAKFLAVAYPAVNAKKVKAPLHVTGMPLRKELILQRNISKSDAISKLNELFECNLDANKNTILVFGGSQGAAIFNEYYPEAFRKLEERDFQILHLTGKGKIETPQKIYQGANFPYLLLESSEKMELFLAAADIAVCRSGGSSLAELALFGVPAILTPYPQAAEGHQTDNAREFAKCDAAKIVPNEELTKEKAVELISEYLDNESDWQKRAQIMATKAMPDATKQLLELIEKALAK